MVILVAFLVGCTSNTVIPVTSTPTIQMAETATRKPTPIFKPTFTRTPTLESPPTPFWIPPTITPRPPDIEAIIQKYPGLGYYIEPSPYGEWVFMGFTAAPYGSLGNTSLLYNLVTRKKWFYSFCTFFQDDKYSYCNDGTFPGEARIYANAWSPDGKYLYAEIISGGDGGFGFGGGMKLIRINLQSGVASIYIDIGAVYSFSPEMDRLVYIPWSEEGPPDVMIRDMQDSSEYTLVLEPKYDVAGDIVWSPDGTRFVFLVEDLNESRDDLISTSLMLVDVTNHSQVVLIKDQPGFPDIREWLTNGDLIYWADAVQYSIPDRQLWVTPLP
jgi:hypothetical protein